MQLSASDADSFIGLQDQVIDIVGHFFRMAIQFRPTTGRIQDTTRTNVSYVHEFLDSSATIIYAERRGDSHPLASAEAILSLVATELQKSLRIPYVRHDYLFDTAFIYCETCFGRQAQMTESLRNLVSILQEYWMRFNPIPDPDNPDKCLGVRPDKKKFWDYAARMGIIISGPASTQPDHTVLDMGTPVTEGNNEE